MIVIGVIALILVVGYLFSPKPARHIYHISPNPLKKYFAPAGWKGTPIDTKGRFVNEEFPFYQDFLKIIIWLPAHLINLVRNRRVKFPAVHHSSADILKKDDTLIWLDHASFFLRTNGANILIDPNFNNFFIYRKHSDNPIDPALFRNIQYILLSHDHADHCDRRSLELLIKNNPTLTILCGLNMDRLIQSLVKPEVTIVTAEWYEEFPLPGPIKIYFTPSRHYSKRLFKKFNSTLWGGFIIRYENAAGKFETIYYGGDSGYGSHFSSMKELFSPSLAILPIGSYSPRWFMKANHMSPAEAVQAFHDCGAKKLIPMHYGTFNLSNEKMDEPKKILQEILPTGRIEDLRVGETFTISNI